jgi:hypothetical protein
MGAAASVRNGSASRAFSLNRMLIKSEPGVPMTGSA